jgi:glutamate/tyrosine decarboxylase-like PLP-dependent enzyme
VLNTNVHAYSVAPFLTLVEKHVTARLASLLGFPASSSGGIAQPGGSASNSSSIIIARNTLFPSTKSDGIHASPVRYTLFTSAHGHYSIEKAAQCFGFGSSSVIPVPVDSDGRMRADELDRLVQASKARGEVPFYVNATAGTTVLGSYDPFDEISAVAKKHGMWLHVDGSWGGAVLFSEKYRASRLKGVELADSVAITPHKMLAVPMTSSFLIVRDMKHTHAAMTLPAG